MVTVLLGRVNVGQAHAHGRSRCNTARDANAYLADAGGAGHGADRQHSGHATTDGDLWSDHAAGRQASAVDIDAFADRSRIIGCGQVRCAGVKDCAWSSPVAGHGHKRRPRFQHVWRVELRAGETSSEDSYSSCT